jgi:hypothetical protein
VIVARDADASNPPEYAYQDITFGNWAGSTWTLVELSAAANAAAITAMRWLDPDNFYVSTEGDIYFSTDFGATPTLIYDGGGAAPDINALEQDKDGNVYAVGASNTILRKLDGGSSFATRTGPSGGGTMTAVAVANDGRVIVGNDTGLFVSTDGAGSAGNWTTLYAWPANHVVRKIRCLGRDAITNGDSQLLHFLIDDTVGGAGEYWYSINGGLTAYQVPQETNTGYNDVFWPEFDNDRAVVVGDADATPLGTVHIVAPAA